MNDIEALKKLDMVTLVDMLARKTDEYMRIQREGGSTKEHKACKEAINTLMQVIQDRRKDQ
jgi:hypothetical protein